MEGLVSEMATARDMQDARCAVKILRVEGKLNPNPKLQLRSRAIKILSSFERFVLDHSSASQVGGSNPALLKANEDLSKENAILKRAVQIQNHKLVERAQANEAETSQLRGLVAHQQEQIRQLEMSNYSLAIHLQRAEQGGQMGGHRHPDIF